MPTSTRRIQYRRLNRSDFSFSGSLQSAVEAALDVDGQTTKIGVAVRERRVDLDQDGKSTILNGYQSAPLAKGSDIFAGQIILYRPGIDIPAIEEDLVNLKSTFQVMRYQADENRKPIEGILHFVAYQDHVGLIESSAVRSRWLERYLTWLLQGASGVLAQNSFVTLDASFSSDSGVTPPRSAKALSLPTKPVRLMGRGNKAVKSTVDRGSRAGASVVKILELLGWRKDEVQSLLDTLPEGTDLYGELKVYAKDGRKAVPFQTSALETALRNAPDGDINMLTETGNLRGKSYKLSERKVVSTIGDNLLDPDDATDKIWAQLLEWGSTGRIDLKV